MSDRTNQAVDRLAAALHELSYRGRIAHQPDVRMLLSPGKPTIADARHMHALGFSVDVVEVLADFVEQLLQLRAATAAQFADANPELAQAIADTFSRIDVDDLARTVLADADPRDHAAINRALDALFHTEDPQEDGDTE